jgi:hypothetical protein
MNRPLSKHDFFRWLKNEPAVAWLCPQCGDMQAVVTDENGNEPECPQCWQCGATTERALVEKA